MQLHNIILTNHFTIVPCSLISITFTKKKLAIFFFKNSNNTARCDTNQRT